MISRIEPITLSFMSSSFALGLIRLTEPTSLIFDQTILIILFSALIYSLMYRLRQISSLTFKKVFLGLLVFYFFSTTILMNIDRSRSFYVLKWIEICRSESCPWENIEKYGTSGRDDFLLRIEEQISRKLVYREGEMLTLSKGGEVLIRTSIILADIFSLKEFQKQ